MKIAAALQTSRQINMYDTKDEPPSALPAPPLPARFDNAAALRAALSERPFGKALCDHFSDHRRGRILRAVCGRLASVTVVMENLVDKHNVAAVLRTAEGLGLCALHAVELTHRWEKHKAIARSADDWIVVHKHDGIAAALAGLQQQGFVIAAADVGSNCVPLRMLPVDKPIAVVFGSEHDGLSKRALSLADVRFTVPMYGLMESFNVGVTAGMVLQDLTSRRRVWMGADGDLTRDEQMARAHRDLKRALKNRELYEHLRELYAQPDEVLP
jgi:tRNA (guanosine-2'-O-)-methyltransferase